MKPARAYGAIAVWAAVWFAVVSSLAASLCAQEATGRTHTGVSQDWSQQIVFSRDGLAQHPDLIDREPRVLHQAVQRWQAPNFGAFDGSEPAKAPADNSGLHSDWNVTPFGGHVLIGAYPAKFSFNPGAPADCTNDYVVFGLNTASTGNQANLVVLNNLYSTQPLPGGQCGNREERTRVGDGCHLPVAVRCDSFATDCIPPRKSQERNAANVKDSQRISFCCDWQANCLP